MSDKIPIEYVEGPTETTVWMWPDAPDPVTVRFPSDEWEKIKEAADAEYGGDVAAFVTRVVNADIQEHLHVLGSDDT